MNLYELLGIKSDTDNETIRQVILQQVNLWNQRKGIAATVEKRREAEDRVAAIAEARRVLLDVERRQEYDRFLTQAGQPLGSSPPAPEKGSADPDRNPCPFCGELIPTTANKCRWCNEWLQKPVTSSKLDTAMPEPASDAKSFDTKATRRTSRIALLLIGPILIGGTITTLYFYEQHLEQVRERIEQEGKQAEEQRRQAEEQRRQADEQVRIAIEQSRQAENEAKIATEQRRQAEIERSQANTVTSQISTERAESVNNTTADQAIQHINRGADLFHSGRYSEARAEWQEAMKINPNDALANYNLGMLYYETGRLQDALPLLLEAARLDPNFAKTRQYLACLYARLGNHDLALAHLEKVIAIQPGLKDWMRRDPDLESVRGEERYHNLLATRPSSSK